MLTLKMFQVFLSDFIQIFKFRQGHKGLVTFTQVSDGSVHICVNFLILDIYFLIKPYIYAVFITKVEPSKQS